MNPEEPLKSSCLNIDRLHLGFSSEVFKTNWTLSDFKVEGWSWANWKCLCDLENIPLLFFRLRSKTSSRPQEVQLSQRHPSTLRRPGWLRTLTDTVRYSIDSLCKSNWLTVVLLLLLSSWPRPLSNPLILFRQKKKPTRSPAGEFYFESVSRELRPSIMSSQRPQALQACLPSKLNTSSLRMAALHHTPLTQPASLPPWSGGDIFLILHIITSS